MDNTEAAKHAMDVVSLGTVIGTLAGWLPSAAAALTVVWTLIRISESNTAKCVAGRIRKWMN